MSRPKAPDKKGWMAWFKHFRDVEKWESSLTESEQEELETLDFLSEGYGLMADAVQNRFDEYLELMERKTREQNQPLRVEYSVGWTGGHPDDGWSEPCSSPGNAVNQETSELAENLRHRFRSERDANGDFYYLVAFVLNRRDDECIADKEEMDYEVNDYTDEDDGDHIIGYKLIGEHVWHSSFEGMVREMDARDKNTPKVVEEPHHKHDFMNVLAVYVKDDEDEWEHAYSYGYNKQATAPEKFAAVKSIWHYLEHDCGLDDWLAVHLTANRERKVPAKERI